MSEIPEIDYEIPRRLILSGEGLDRMDDEQYLAFIVTLGGLSIDVTSADSYHLSHKSSEIGSSPEQVNDSP